MRCEDSASHCETAIQSSGSSNASMKLAIDASWYVAVIMVRVMIVMRMAGVRLAGSAKRPLVEPARNIHLFFSGSTRRGTE